jgi:ABC-type transporter Mla subunit MlaD
MQKTIANELSQFAQNLESRYSRHDREGNYNKETFKVVEINPTSDHTAVLIFEKNTGKRAAFFCYYINRGMSKGWKYFVPTDSHINGFRAFEFYKMQIEKYNYKYNFNGERN